MFAVRISEKTLSTLCRSLSTMLRSGVEIIKSLQIAAKKTGNSQCRQSLAEVADSLRGGDDLTTAFRGQGGYFPPLFIDMVHVAESTGAMPEVLKELAIHYENNVRLRREFLSMIAWPMIQLIAAILVIALMIFLLGIIASSQGVDPLAGEGGFDPLGFGLLGTEGALTWLGYSFGSIFTIIFGYFLLTRTLAQRQIVHRLLLKIPVVGNCLRSFAIARFAWALYLTQGGGMPIKPSLDASLRATGNGAFVGAAPRIIDTVMAGDELGTALDESRLFTEEFIHIVQVAEATGTVPEELHRLSPEFEERARRSIRTLAIVAGWLVWLCVAVMIIFLIFRIMLWYVDLLNKAGEQI